MRLRRLTLISFAAVAAALVVVLPVAAKEGVKATFRTSIPLDASAGSQLEVAWRLFSVDESGEHRPFGANGVFARVRSASGGETREGFAALGDHATGEYEAIVIVPEGGSAMSRSA